MRTKKKKIPPFAEREILKFELRALRAEKRVVKLTERVAQLEAENHRLMHDEVITPGMLKALAKVRREVQIAERDGSGQKP